MQRMENTKPNYLSNKKYYLYQILISRLNCGIIIHLNDWLPHTYDSGRQSLYSFFQLDYIKVLSLSQQKKPPKLIGDLISHSIKKVVITNDNIIIIFIYLFVNRKRLLNTQQPLLSPERGEKRIGNYGKFMRSTSLYNQIIPY